MCQPVRWPPLFWVTMVRSGLASGPAVRASWVAAAMSSRGEEDAGFEVGDAAAEEWQEAEIVGEEAYVVIVGEWTVIERRVPE